MTSNAAPAGADTWQQIQAAIRANLTPQAFSNWFERTAAATLPDGSITLTAASEPAARFISEEYAGLLASLAARYAVPAITVSAPSPDAPPTAPATPAVTRVSVIGRYGKLPPYAPQILDIAGYNRTGGSKAWPKKPSSSAATRTRHGFPGTDRSKRQTAPGARFSSNPQAQAHHSAAAARW